MQVCVAKPPDLRLPFPPGESWVLTRAYNNTSHVYYGPWADDRYAIDFAEVGCESVGKHILAAASGIVEIQSLTDSGGYGIHLLINHSDGYKTRYAHLSTILVDHGQWISQGDTVGIIGNTGSVWGKACPELLGMHLHFVLYHQGVGVKPEPISGYTNLRAGHYYTSDNFRRNTSVCARPVEGGWWTNWWYECTPVQTTFDHGQHVYTLIRLYDIAHNHRYRVKAFRDDVFQWEWTTHWNHVEPWVWQYSHFWPVLYHATPGEWQFEMQIDFGDGFLDIESLYFTVQ